jgi:hypothetical protein
MIKVFLNWVQKTKPHIKSETGLLLFVPTIKLTVYLRIPCRIFINSLYNTESKSPTTSSTGGLILALQRAILLLAPQGGVTSTFTGPL